MLLDNQISNYKVPDEAQDLAAHRALKTARLELAAAEAAGSTFVDALRERVKELSWAMVRGHLRQAKQLAVKFARQTTSVTADDLMQDAVAGMLAAARDFDPDRGARFATYAYWQARLSIQTNLNGAGNRKRQPKCGLPRDSEGDEIDVEDAVGLSPVAEAQGRETSEVLAALLGSLPPEMREVIEAKYLRGVPYVEQAEALGVDRRVINSVASRALRHLRAVDNRKLRECLA